MDKNKRKLIGLLRRIYLGVILFSGIITILSSGGGGGGSDGDNNTSTPSLSSIAVSPVTGSIPLGNTQSFTATGIYSDSSSKDLTSSAAWSSSDTAVATIDASGVATSKGQGTATISATASGVSGNATLTITQAELASITITPAAPTLHYNGASQQFTATGVYTDNSTLDITNSATWSSSDVATATIGLDGFSRVVAIAGSTTISAALGTISGVATLTLQTATISGQITFPESDMGWQPSLSNSAAKVRVEGTDIYADVVRSTDTKGVFTLTGVPYGTVTLLFEEGMNTSADVQNDAFTQSSKRMELEVNADTVSGVVFNLVYHWKELAGYPDAWSSDDLDWTPRAFFVNEQVAFILLRLDTNPDRIELYRTLDRGAAWELIGSWTYDDDDYSSGGAWPAYWLDLYFTDQDHGIVLATTHCTPCSDCGSGYYYTTDGGENWTLTSLPWTPTGYDINPSSYARIGADHLIMGGTVGCGVQGYNDGFYDAVWESEDGGYTWECKWHSDIDEMGDVIGLDANAEGKAIGFRGDDIQEFLLRDVQGNWSSHANTEGINDTARDIAMAGETAWIRNKGGTASDGIYQTTDAGETWSMISDMILVDFDFATIKKGFNHTSGDTYVTYDGGVTWRYQGMGGYIWPGNMDIWAFDTTHAAWAEGGSYSDPNDEKDLFTYVEPWEGNFEIATGVSLSDAYISSGTENVPMASYQFNNQGPVPIRVNSITLVAAGSGVDTSDITAVKLWRDMNSDGALNSEDTMLTTADYGANNGTVTLTMDMTLEQFIPVQLLVTYDLGSSINSGGTFRISLDPGDINAKTADTDDDIAPSAPTGFVLTGRTITVSP